MNSGGGNCRNSLKKVKVEKQQQTRAKNTVNTLAVNSKVIKKGATKNSEKTEGSTIE